MIAFKILLFFVFLSAVFAFRRQSVAVQGRLMCGSMPARGVLVKLFDEDDGPDPDDLLDHGYTDNDGKFSLSGDTVEFTNIDPELRVYHSCNNYVNPCNREWIIQIPDKYISAGKTPTKVFDFGTMNLEIELEDEGHDCIH
uniref:Uncharacterized protein n=1 Tax=Panagrolaimus davidi TaxID=227884 RepID=A0A914PJJ2_9BILA